MCHLSHLFVPLTNHENIIWEVHYSWVARHFNMGNMVGFFWITSIRKIFPSTLTYIISSDACAICKFTFKKKCLYTHLLTLDNQGLVSMEFISSINSTKNGHYFGFVHWSFFQGDNFVTLQEICHRRRQCQVVLQTCLGLFWVSRDHYLW